MLPPADPAGAEPRRVAQMLRHEVPKTAGTMPYGTFYDPAMVSHLLGSHAPGATPADDRGGWIAGDEGLLSLIAVDVVDAYEPAHEGHHLAVGYQHAGVDDPLRGHPEGDEEQSQATGAEHRGPYQSESVVSFVHSRIVWITLCHSIVSSIAPSRPIMRPTIRGRMEEDRRLNGCSMVLSLFSCEAFVCSICLVT